MPLVAFASVGCKLNRYEIQVMSEALAPYGFETVSFGRVADCYVVNTCSVTGDADLSSRQLIRRAKRKNPNARVVVTGCYAQLKPEELRELGVDAVVSNRDKEKLPAIILELFGRSPSDFRPEIDHLISGMGGLTRAFVKIEDGCDDRCTFCAIWMARGPVVSRRPDAVIDEIKKLAANGYKEVALTGVHIGKYNFDGLDFTGLLGKLVRESEIERIRLSSLNPSEITPELVELMSSLPRICPHVHLSIQSGDDDVLRFMGRKYGRGEITGAIDALSAAIPNITLGADLIVGFPGETGERFENTRKLIEEVNLHHLHVFPYSDRQGTVAAGLPDKIEPREKARRTTLLRNIGQAKKIKHLNNFVGKKQRVLFENRDSRDTTTLTGLSENYLRVSAPADDGLKGHIVDVVPYEVRGEILISNVIIGTGDSKKELTLSMDENIIREPLKKGLDS